MKQYQRQGGGVLLKYQALVPRGGAENTPAGDDSINTAQGVNET
jgi:hypothetical protein